MGRCLVRLRSAWSHGVAAATVALAGLGLACGGNGSDPVDPGPGPSEPPPFDLDGTWDRWSALPEGVISPIVVTRRDRVLVIGGLGGDVNGPALSAVYALDPVTRNVTQLSDFPERIAEGAAVVYRDTLLVIGGNTQDRIGIDPRASVWFYDDATDTWDLWSTLPDRRRSHAAVVVGDRIVVIGGDAFTRPPGDSIVVFEGRTSRYGPPPPATFISPMSAAATTGGVYAIGSLFFPTLMRYDVSAETWEAIGASPFRAMAGGGAFGNALHGFSTGPDALHRFFRAGATTWSTAPLAPETVQDAGVVAFEGALLLIGGETTTGEASRSVQEFTPSG